MRTQDAVCVKGPAHFRDTDTEQMQPPAPASASHPPDPASHPTPEMWAPGRPTPTEEVGLDTEARGDPSTRQVHVTIFPGRNKNKMSRKRQQIGIRSLALSVWAFSFRL